MIMIKMFFKLPFVFGTELIAVILLALGIIPQTIWQPLVILLTLYLMSFILLAETPEALMLFILSIPLYIALPLPEPLKDMANWRPLLAVFFLVWIAKDFLASRMKLTQYLWTRWRPNRFSAGAAVFLGIALLSLKNASYAMVGMKQILFLANIFLLAVIVGGFVKRKEDFTKVLSISGVTAILTIGIGYIQFLAAQFADLYSFWQFWAGRVIPIFYGTALSELLKQSNTWFSYYESSPPTLRMFSIFPDSHSFALFSIIGTSILLTNFLIAKGKKQFLWGLATVFGLAGILFSGSRGTWAAAVLALLASALLLFFISRKSFTFGAWKIRLGLDDSHAHLKIMQRIFLSLMVFFLIFPVSSFFFPHGRGVKTEESALAFKRASSILDVREKSNRQRLDIWFQGMRSIGERPFLGVGFGNFPLILEQDIETGKKGASAHNLYLHIAAETGIFGLLAMLTVFFFLFQRAWQLFTASTANEYRIFGGVLTLYFLWIFGYNFFDVVLLNDKVLLFFMVAVGLIASAGNVYEPDSSVPS